MHSYIVQSAEDFGHTNEDFHLSVPSMMIYAAFVFHYHIIDHSPQIHEQQCVWRVVVTTDYFEDRVDIENLWERVIDTLLDLETGEDVTLMDWSIMEAIPCTDCMTPDSIFVMEKCQLCNAPLCKSCYSERTYCEGHLN